MTEVTAFGCQRDISFEAFDIEEQRAFTIASWEESSMFYVKEQNKANMHVAIKR